jgi:TrmH family RNA methyltransferase
MLTKATTKFIKSLQVKKYRKQEQCFLVEGGKSVQELLASDFETLNVFGTADFLSTLTLPAGLQVVQVSEAMLEGLGGFQTNRTALAVARMKPNTPLYPSASEYAIALDDLKDPGNLGTIIRTADWFGIRKIIASPSTADFYNPKVISATMGSFTRVQVYYTDLSAFFTKIPQPVYGACLQGTDVHNVAFQKSGCILIGSESHGISPVLMPFVTHKITIPRFGLAESLNAAMATAIICDNLRSSLVVPHERPSPLQGI